MSHTDAHATNPTPNNHVMTEAANNLFPTNGLGLTLHSPRAA